MPSRCPNLLGTSILRVVRPAGLFPDLSTITARRFQAGGGALGLLILSNNNCIRELAITNFDLPWIVIDHGLINIIQYNYIGLDAAFSVRACDSIVTETNSARLEIEP